MKRNPDFIMQEIGRDALLLPVGDAAGRFRSIVRLNETAACLVQKLRKYTTPEQLCTVLEAHTRARRYGSRSPWSSR